MLFQTTTDGAKRLIEADSAQQAAQIAERDSEGAAQVICVDRAVSYCAKLRAHGVTPTVPRLMRGVRGIVRSQAERVINGNA